MRLVLAVLAGVCLLPVAAVGQHGGGGGGGMHGGGNNRTSTQKAPKADPPLAPFTEPNAKYPLKVKLLQAESKRTVEGSVASEQTVGSGNLVGEKTVGFDFNSSCPGGLTSTSGDGFYQAKWKKQDKKMELLTLMEGKTKSSTCSIEVTMKDKPYASGEAQ